MASPDDDVTKIDIYELLGIPVESSESTIRRAYRKKALTCHPDKHPDDPKAADSFRTLSRALEILLDPNARADYDKILKARKYRAVKYKELDSKRQKLRDDLEENEKRAYMGQDRDTEMEAQMKLSQHIARIRREGSKQLEEENLKLERQFNEERRKQLEKTNQKTSLESPPVTSHQKRRLQSQIYGHSNIPHLHQGSGGTTNQSKLDASLSDEEYEKLVLTRLRQAQQLKSLNLND